MSEARMIFAIRFPCWETDLCNWTKVINLPSQKFIIDNICGKICKLKGRLANDRKIAYYSR